jgi:DNA-binding protein HU-beta
VNKNDLIARVAQKTYLPKAKAAQVLDAMIAVISGVLKRGGTVRLVGFGTFSVIQRKATEGRNPRTGAAITIPARNKPKFKAGMALNKAVNKNKAN